MCRTKTEKSKCFVDIWKYWSEIGTLPNLYIFIVDKSHHWRSVGSYVNSLSCVDDMAEMHRQWMLCRTLLACVRCIMASMTLSVTPVRQDTRRSQQQAPRWMKHLTSTRLTGCDPILVDCFPYLTHVINQEMADEDDTEYMMTKLSVISNVLLRRLFVARRLSWRFQNPLVLSVLQITVAAVQGGLPEPT